MTNEKPTKPKSAPKSREALIMEKWGHLRQAIESSDEQEIDLWAVELNLDERQVQFCEAALDELASLTSILKTTADAAQRAADLSVALDQLNQLRPQSTDDCLERAKKFNLWTQERSAAQRDAAVHQRALEHKAGILWHAWQLIGKPRSAVGERGSWSPRLKNLMNELNLDSSDPLASNQPDPPRRRQTLVASAPKFSMR